MGGSRDADTDSDTDADTDSDTDADTTALPDDMGFNFDGAFYPLTEEAVFCQTSGEHYVFSSGALRDGTGVQGNGYAYFAAAPAPGTYTVVNFDGARALGAGEAAVAVIDYGTFAFWYSTGTGGTLTVSLAPDGSTDVVWRDVTLGTGSSTTTSSVGWLRC